MAKNEWHGLRYVFGVPTSEAATRLQERVAGVIFEETQDAVGTATQIALAPEEDEWWPHHEEMRTVFWLLAESRWWAEWWRAEQAPWGHDPGYYQRLTLPWERPANG